MDRPVVPLSGTAGRLCVRGRNVRITAAATAWASCAASATHFGRIPFPGLPGLPIEPAIDARGVGWMAPAARATERNWVPELADMPGDASPCGRCEKSSAAAHWPLTDAK
jgi:hypothetical protein